MPDKTDTVHIRQLLDGWYHTQAERVFCEPLAAMLPRSQDFGIAQPALAIKPLRARWGSHSGSGTITLNLQLMQTLKQYIDSVVIHEQTHLVEHNRSRPFYLLIDCVMPDWRD